MKWSNPHIAQMQMVHMKTRKTVLLDWVQTCMLAHKFLGNKGCFPCTHAISLDVYGAIWLYKEEVEGKIEKCHNEILKCLLSDCAMNGYRAHAPVLIRLRLPKIDGKLMHTWCHHYVIMVCVTVKLSGWPVVINLVIWTVFSYAFLHSIAIYTSLIFFVRQSHCFF